jgi:hypothetical protein
MTNINKQARFEAIVKALLAKTVEAGATEAEAMAAAEKARDLIDRYQLDLGAEEVIKEGVERFEFRPPSGYHYQFLCWSSVAIARYCEVEVWFAKRIVPAKRARSGATNVWAEVLCAAGLKSDLEFFKYLVAHLSNFAVNGANEWALAQPYGTLTGLAKERVDFIKACGARITHRLRDLTIERNRRHKTSDGRALVVINKRGLVSDYLVKHGLQIRKGRSISRHRSHGSEAGAAHGDKATFGRPVGGPGGVAGLIGKG